jgi:hypothetical protein
VLASSGIPSVPYPYCGLIYGGAAHNTPVSHSVALGAGKTYLQSTEARREVRLGTSSASRVFMTP